MTTTPGGAGSPPPPTDAPPGPGDPPPVGPGAPPPVGPGDPPPAGAAGPGVPPSGGEPSGTRFWDWLLHLGVRRQDERWVGGVCAALAARVGVDPLLVRAVVVLLALLGGGGVAVYAIAWLLLPDARGRIEARQVVRGDVSGSAVAALALLLVSGVVPQPWQWWEPGVLVGGDDVVGVLLLAALTVALVVWVQRRGRGARAGAGTADGSGSGERTAAAAGTTPGVRRRPTRARTGVVGLAAVLGGLTWWALTRTGVPGASAAGLPSRVAEGRVDGFPALAVSCAVATLVLGLGVVVAGARGRSGAGMSGLGVSTAVVAASLALVPGGLGGQVVGSPTWAPTTAAEAQQGFGLAAGDLVVDLTALPRPAAREVVRVPVRTGAGDVEVRLPDDATAVVRSRLGAGAVRSDGDDDGATWEVRGHDEGLFADVVVRRTGSDGTGSDGTGPGADGSDGEPGRLVVDVVTGAGQVEVVGAGSVLAATDEEER